MGVVGWVDGWYDLATCTSMPCAGDANANEATDRGYGDAEGKDCIECKSEEEKCKASRGSKGQEGVWICVVVLAVSSAMTLSGYAASEVCFRSCLGPCHKIALQKRCQVFVLVFSHPCSHLVTMYVFREWLQIMMQLSFTSICFLIPRLLILLLILTCVIFIFDTVARHARIEA